MVSILMLHKSSRNDLCKILIRFNIIKYVMIYLCFLILYPMCLLGEESQDEGRSKNFDFYSFNPLSLIPGSFPNNMVESIKLKTPDPYVKPKSFWVKELELSEKKYCGIKIESHEANHEFKSFNSQKDLLQQGFLITHKGACGTCSSVQDLKVYLDRPNLTSPVRRCGALSFKWPVIQCLRRLGFSEPCSETWYYNIVQTRKKCARVCLQSWWKNEDFNQEDGALNACLACDENESGPAFKVTAGRTRRRSGIQSAIKRMEHEFFRLSHEY